MKLSNVLQPGGKYEIHLSDGTKLILAGPGGSVQIEKVGDDEQVLHLQTVVTGGRYKGQKARTIIPYVSIAKILIAP